GRHHPHNESDSSDQGNRIILPPRLLPHLLFRSDKRLSFFDCVAYSFFYCFKRCSQLLLFGEVRLYRIKFNLHVTQPVHRSVKSQFTFRHFPSSSTSGIPSATDTRLSPRLCSP